MFIFMKKNISVHVKKYFFHENNLKESVFEENKQVYNL